MYNLKKYKKMDNLEKLIRTQTNYMFTDVFYENFTKKIQDFVSENKHNSGYVYLIKNGKFGNNVKIGSAIDIDNRVFSYQTAFHEKIFIVGYIKTENYIFVEKDIHKLFSDKKIKGEWFNIDDLDIFTLKEIYQYNEINDFYNKSIKIEKMTPQKSISDFSELIEFCKNLEINKSYKTSGLFKKFIQLNPDCKIKSTSWFGREISNIFKSLGLKKIDSTAGGIRTFILK